MDATTASEKGFIEAHLESRDVARVIYGAIIGLALVVALEGHPPSAGESATAIISTAVAVGLAELYSEAIGAEARTHRRVHLARLRALAREAGAVTFGAAFPAAFFIAAAFDLMSVDLAFTLSKWTGLGLIGLYGFLAARLAGARFVGALVQALAVLAIGAVLIVIKAVLH